MSAPVTLVIAEDHPVFRKGLLDVLRSTAFSVVGEAGNGARALELVRQYRPSIALLDIEMPVANGFSVAESIRTEGLGSAVVILTMFKDAAMLRRALDVGALGYVLKDSAVTELVACLEAVSAGHAYVSPALSGALLERRADRESADAGLRRALTQTERRVLRLIAQDMTSAEIADSLGISPKTVDNHRSHICRKLGLTGPQALLRFALANNGQFE